MPSGITVEPVHPLFGARVHGLDLRQPLSPEALAEVKAAFSRYAVLVFPGQNLTDDEQVAFSQNFGPLEPLANYSGPAKRLSAQISDLSNLNPDGTLWDPNSHKRMFNLANMLWHTDSSFKDPPALCSLLSARAIPPEGGETEFTDLRAAYEALDPDTQTRLSNLVVEHDIFHSRAQVGFTAPDPALKERFPSQLQRLVRTHFPSGRKALYLASHCKRIVGEPDDGRALLDELLAFATQERFVYRHLWQQYDLVMWDNRCTMHRGLKYDDLKYTRDMRRTTISEHAGTLAQEPLATQEA